MTMVWMSGAAERAAAMLMALVQTRIPRLGPAMMSRASWMVVVPQSKNTASPSAMQS